MVLAGKRQIKVATYPALSTVMIMVKANLQGNHCTIIYVLYHLFIAFGKSQWNRNTIKQDIK